MLCLWFQVRFMVWNMNQLSYLNVFQRTCPIVDLNELWFHFVNRFLRSELQHKRDGRYTSPQGMLDLSFLYGVSIGLYHIGGKTNILLKEVTFKHVPS